MTSRRRSVTAPARLQREQRRGSKAGPGSVVGVVLDVSDPSAWLELRELIKADFGGRVDGLINNAGVTSRVPLPDVELEEWNRVLAISSRGRCSGSRRCCR